MNRRATVLANDTRRPTSRSRIDLDGTGSSRDRDRRRYLDHLLTSLAHHGMIDLTMRTDGDLHIDEHHTVEDTALVLGSAIDEALGDRSGITRFASATVPMDEADRELRRPTPAVGRTPCSTLHSSATGSERWARR